MTLFGPDSFVLCETNLDDSTDSGNFISNDLTQMVNFPTWIPDCDSHNSILLDLFISSDASICCIMAFPPLGSSDYNVVSVFVVFPINSKWDALFHYVAYQYFLADWDGLCNHLRDVL